MTWWGEKQLSLFADEKTRWNGKSTLLSLVRKIRIIISREFSCDDHQPFWTQGIYRWPISYLLGDKAYRLRQWNAIYRVPIFKNLLYRPLDCSLGCMTASVWIGYGSVQKARGITFPRSGDDGCVVILLWKTDFLQLEGEISLGIKGPCRERYNWNINTYLSMDELLHGLDTYNRWRWNEKIIEAHLLLPW